MKVGGGGGGGKVAMGKEINKCQAFRSSWICSI